MIIHNSLTVCYSKFYGIGLIFKLYRRQNDSSRLLNKFEAFYAILNKVGDNLGCPHSSNQACTVAKLCPCLSVL
jgi:hypothetical protein